MFTFKTYACIAALAVTMLSGCSPEQTPAWTAAAAHDAIVQCGLVQVYNKKGLTEANDTSEIRKPVYETCARFKRSASPEQLAELQNYLHDTEAYRTLTDVAAVCVHEEKAHGIQPKFSDTPDPYYSKCMLAHGYSCARMRAIEKAVGNQSENCQ